MKTDDIYEEIFFRFLVMRMRFIWNIKNIPWRLKLVIIDSLVEILNSLCPYCRECMDTSHYWTKCKPFKNYPHSNGWSGWKIGKKDCYMKGFKK